LDVPPFSDHILLSRKTSSVSYLLILNPFFLSYTKCIKDVILYCVGKINTSKAWVAGSRYSPFKTHHADRVDFNQPGWSLIWCVWY